MANGPRLTGTCWCGCGEETGPGSFFASGHDRKAEAALIRLEYGSVVRLLEEHGYGPGGKNLMAALSTDLEARLPHQQYPADDRELLSDLSAQTAPAGRVARLMRQQRETETRYRTLVEQIPAITYIQEPIESSNPKAITYMSPQHETILGFQVIDEEHWLSLLHPEDQERVLAEEVRTDQTGEPFKVEYRIIAEDGRVVWVRDEATLVRDEGGHPLYWLGVMYDITEQKRETQERERIEQELRVARRIQHAALPEAVPAPEGWEISPHYRPAREVGGDFFDFLELEEGRLGLVVGDATGKGVPAALMMSTTCGMLRAVAQSSGSPGEVLQRVNEALSARIPANMFVTCFYGVLDPESGSFVYANAGHDLPYMRRGGDAEELRARGMPLGLMLGMGYEEKEIVLGEGESVLFYSDGLVEAHNPQGEMFGFPKLRRLVTVHGTGSGEDLVDSLLAELARFAGEEWEQEDDITLLTLRRSATRR